MNKTFERTLCYVLLSGGLDSSVATGLAIRDFGRNNVRAISMMYGQRHSREIHSAQRICSLFGIPHRTARMAEQPESMLTNANSVVPDMSYSEMGAGRSPTYVPFRNGQMMSYLTALVEADLKDTEDAYIYVGMHAEDAQNWAYADCTPEFIGAMANAIYIGTYGRVRLKAPLMHFVKAEIVTVGDQLEVPMHETWSCYKGDNLQCGTCPTCISRKEAFDIANVVDRTVYEV